jgi:hypothetical protein
MLKTAARITLAVLVAATGMYAGILLGRYAEADDAPGGVVIAMFLMFGSLALGCYIALRGRPKKST